MYRCTTHMSPSQHLRISSPNSFRLCTDAMVEAGGGVGMPSLLDWRENFLHHVHLEVLKEILLKCIQTRSTGNLRKVIGERERANLVVQLARFFYIYIYVYMYIGIYPALMYAVMFYVILNKRKRLGDCVTFLYLSLWHIP